jgi:uncharacterized membrane protein YvbJ
MAMKCPKCGRAVQDKAGYCAVCGSPVGDAYAQAQYAMQKPLRKKKASTALIVVIVVVVVAIVGSVGWLMLSASSSPFTADLRYQVLT